MPCPRKMALHSGKKKYPVESVPAFPGYFFCSPKLFLHRLGLLMIPKPQKRRQGKTLPPVPTPTTAQPHRIVSTCGTARASIRRIRDRHIFARQTADGFLKMEKRFAFRDYGSDLRAHAEVLYALVGDQHPSSWPNLRSTPYPAGKAFLGQAPPHRFRPARTFRPHGRFLQGHGIADNRQVPSFALNIRFSDRKNIFLFRHLNPSLHRGAYVQKTESGCSP